MAATYEPIATNTVSGSSTTTITFSSIPATYTDLILITQQSNSSNQSSYLRVNGDTGSNYSSTYLGGDGSSSYSGRRTNQTSFINDFATTYTSLAMDIIHFMNYANTTTYKTIIGRDSVASVSVATAVGLWRSTAAINSISLQVAGGNLVAGSTFTLYGIKAA